MFFYIIAISFQISGALLLLIMSLSTKKTEILKRFKGKGIIIRDNNTNEVDVNKEELKNEFTVSYISRWAFFYISFGYLIGVFGRINDNCRIIAFFIIIGLSSIIIIITKIGILFYANRLNKKIFDVTDKDLKSAGIEPDISNIPNKDINRLFE